MLPTEEDDPLALCEVPIEPSDVGSRIHRVDNHNGPSIFILELEHEGYDRDLGCAVVSVGPHAETPTSLVGLKRFEIIGGELREESRPAPPNDFAHLDLDTLRFVVASFFPELLHGLQEVLPHRLIREDIRGGGPCGEVPGKRQGLTETRVRETVKRLVANDDETPDAVRHQDLLMDTHHSPFFLNEMRSPLSRAPRAIASFAFCTSVA